MLTLRCFHTNSASIFTLFVVLLTPSTRLQTEKWNFSILLENISFLGNGSPQHLIKKIMLRSL